MHPKPNLLALLVVMLLPSCGGSDGSSPSQPGPDPTPLPVPVTELRSAKVRVAAPTVASEDAAAFAHDNLAFSVDLYHAVKSRNPGNFLYSQTSISTALAMLYAGAGPTTAAAMAHALRFGLPPPRLHAAFNALDLALTTPPPGNNPAAFRLTIANSAWIQDGFTVLPNYLDTLAEHYGAGLFVEKFATAPEPARKAINDWVAYRTENEISSLFPQGAINTLTRMVLANAVFFHGDWKVPFFKDSPNAVFHTLTGDVSVPTMRGSFNSRIWSGPGWSAATLAYVGDTTSMILVVPDAGTFASFEADLTAESLSDIIAGAALATGADLHMPRFQFATDVDLNQVLSELGMPEAFSDQADFSGINGARDLHIQAVVHKAIIKVDEKGTTASAATGVSSGVTSVPPTLIVDRPFLFFIRHEPTGAIQFQGRVVDPR